MWHHVLCLCTWVHVHQTSAETFVFILTLYNRYLITYNPKNKRVNFSGSLNLTTRRHTPVERNLNTHHRGNLRCHNSNLFIVKKKFELIYIFFHTLLTVTNNGRKKTHTQHLTEKKTTSALHMCCCGLSSWHNFTHSHVPWFCSLKLNHAFLSAIRYICVTPVLMYSFSPVIYPKWNISHKPMPQHTFEWVTKLMAC